MKKMIQKINLTLIVALSITLIPAPSQAINLSSFGKVLSENKTMACLVGGLAITSLALGYTGYRLYKNNAQLTKDNQILELNKESYKSALDEERDRTKDLEKTLGRNRLDYSDLMSEKKDLAHKLDELTPNYNRYVLLSTESSAANQRLAHKLQKEEERTRQLSESVQEHSSYHKVLCTDLEQLTAQKKELLNAQDARNRDFEQVNNALAASKYVVQAANLRDKANALIKELTAFNMNSNPQAATAIRTETNKRLGVIAAMEIELENHSKAAQPQRTTSYVGSAGARSNTDQKHSPRDSFSTNSSSYST